MIPIQQKTVLISNREHFIKSELRDFLDQFPERNFITITQSETDKFSITDILIDGLPEKIRARCQQKLENFLAAKYQDLDLIAGKLLSIFPSITNISFQTTSADFHENFRRSLIINTDQGSWFVKFNRGSNTQRLSELIKSVQLQEHIVVPDSFLHENIEFQAVISRDTKICEKDYFFSLGVLLAFCEFFRLRDYHSENLIYSGSKFFLIDNEMIFYPKLNFDFYTNKKNGRLLKFLTDTFLSTNILPVRFPDQEPNKQSLPLNLKDYSSRADQIVSGFRYAQKQIKFGYDFNYTTRLATDTNLKIRCIFRPTAFYAKLLERMSLSEEFYDDKPFDFRILHKLNKYPDSFSQAYEALCKEEIDCLRKGCIPTFFWRNDEVCKAFFQENTWPTNQIAKTSPAHYDQVRLLRFVLSSFQKDWDDVKPTGFDKLVNNYLTESSKLFGAEVNETPSSLSLINLPSSSQKVISALDDGFYSGWAGFWNLSLVTDEQSEAIFKDCLLELNQSSSQTLSLTKGVTGKLRALFLNGRLSSESVTKLVSLIANKNLLKPIAVDGIFGNSNGLWYLLCLIGQVSSDQEIKNQIKDLVKPVLKERRPKNGDYKEWGLAHGMIGTEYLRSTANWLFADKPELDVGWWKGEAIRSVGGKNGICNGVDGLVLVLCSLQTISGNEPFSISLIREPIRVCDEEKNEGLCHGYTGQLWSRTVLSQLKPSTPKSKFGDIGRDRRILNECIGQLNSGALCDLSLFNGVTGKLLVQELRHTPLSINFDLFPSPSRLMRLKL